jgi:carbon storage regulator CsrA
MPNTSKNSNLVFSRRLNESTIIGEGDQAVTVTVLSIQNGQVKLGFSGPRSIAIDREEIRRRKLESPMF